MTKLILVLLIGAAAIIILKSWSTKAAPRKNSQPQLPLSYFATHVPNKGSSEDEDDIGGGGSSRAPDKLKDAKFRERKAGRR